MPAHGQTQEPPSLPTIIGYVAILEQRLESRESQAKAQVTYWQNTVDALTQEIANDKTRSIELSEALTKAQSELSKSQTAYAEIVSLLASSDKALSDYKRTSESQIKALELQVRLYKSASVVVTVSLVATGVYIIGNRLELW